MDDFSDLSQPELIDGEMFEAFGIYTYFEDSGFPKITPDLLRNSLLRANYLPSLNGNNPELPPVFTSATFSIENADVLMKQSRLHKQRGRLGFDYVRFDQMKPDGHARHSGIPHPLAHAKLVDILAKNWLDLEFLTENLNSAIRPLLLKDGRIFSSSYPSPEEPRDLWHDKNARGADYHLKLDIRSFFPSIYTHSIGWVPYGLAEGKAAMTDANHRAAQHFANEIDKAIGFENRNQTAGIVVGPGSSNLVAEYLLSAVDGGLAKKYGTGFRRHIDDYEFYADTKSQAEEFMRDLESGLRNFELYLNPSKTKLTPLSESIDPPWKTRFENVILAEDPTPRQIRSYWNLVLGEFKKSSEVVSLRWGISMIFRATKAGSHGAWVLSFLIDQIRQFPYLAPYLRLTLESEVELSETDLKALQDLVLDKFEGLYSDSRLWILTVLGLNDAITSKIADIALNSGDSLSLCLLYEFKACSPSLIFGNLVDRTPDLHSRDKHWITEYQLFIGGDGREDPDGCFEIMKQGAMDFVDRTLVTPF
jgi:hypothetical protein